MAYPEAPEISTSYTAAEQALGNGTLPGQEMDVDLAAVRASIASTIEFLKGVTRSDGKLANGIVTREALASSLTIGFDPPEIWSAARDYTTSSTVFEGYGFYLCVTAHTSSVFVTDLASGRWALLADLTPPAGALIAANNLSDLPDASNARANLGLGTAATSAATAFQPASANLTAYAAVAPSAAGLALLDDANVAAQRTTLGLGLLAQLSFLEQANLAADMIQTTGTWQAGVGTLDTAVSPAKVRAAALALPGARVLLADRFVGSGSSIAFTEFDSAQYQTYEFELQAVRSQTSTDLTMVFSADGGATYAGGASDYRWSGLRAETTPALTAVGAALSAGVFLTSGSAIDIGSGRFGAAGRVFLFDAGLPSLPTRYMSELAVDTSSSASALFHMQGRRNIAATTNAVAFGVSNNFLSGRIRMFGIRVT